MKRFLSMIFVFVAVFAFASCDNKKSSKNDADLNETETFSEKISVEEGGKIENSDGSISIEIPGGALDTDTMVTMTIYNTPNLFPTKKGEKIISRIVEFEPSGTIFKKPVVISMKSLETVENETVTAAVYHKEENTWSYSEDAAVKFSGYDDKTGEPVITTAAGDPVMLNDTGDPIMMNATGDPIMLAATGDPIMITATGDPIMQTATGDPIMQTTGHFTAFTFIAVKKEAAEEQDDDDTENDDEISDSDTPGDDEPAEEDDDEADTGIIEDDDPTDDGDTGTGVQEPELPKSKAVCTNMTICTDYKGYQILCPEEGGDFYGQDAQYAARGSCVPGRSYQEIIKPDILENPFTEIKDEATGLTWLFTGMRGTYEEVKNLCDFSYDGKEDWRLPTPKELFTFSSNDMLLRGSAADPVLFQWLLEEGSASDWYGIYLWSSVETFVYALEYGQMIPPSAYEYSPECFVDGVLVCVSGEEYGKVKAGNYVSVTENGDETVFDSGMNLYWTKNPVQAESWREALAYCENLEYAGASDWRLPNRNELLTLVDYSKAGSEVYHYDSSVRGESEIPSLFPGMTADIFWSSTSSGREPWIIDMVDGTSYPFGNGSSGGLYMRRSDSAPSVLCVRSKLNAKTDFPACNKTGVAPCKDAKGTIWSSAIYFDRFADYYHISGPRVCGVDCAQKDRGEEERSEGISWYEISETCRLLNEKGSRKWRLPTIDEIRSIVTSEKLKKGGSCGVKEECPGKSCFSEEACTDDKPSETLLFDFGTMLSGTFNLAYFDEESEAFPELWALDTAYGLISTVSETIPVYELVQRCVLDKNLEFETAPYTDPATGLTWSEVSSSYLDLPKAKEYCRKLSEGDYEHWWKVPTIDELKTLVRNCDGNGDPCPVDVSGKYSPFRDVDDLLATDSAGENFYTIYFINVQLYENPSWGGMVRCVADNGPNLCADDPCRDVAHSDGVCNVTDNSGVRTYACGCKYPYEWDGAKCSSICAANPCGSVPHSTGICTPKSETEYECGCAAGRFWNGSECVNPCAGDPCADVDNSTHECVPKTATEYECVCEDIHEWTGSKCEGPCDSDPCAAFENSTGECTAVTLDFYTCGCEDGFFWLGMETGCGKPTLGRICTGLTKCHNADGGEIDCSATGDFFGQDAYYAALGKCAPHNFAVETVSGDAVVVDKNTGLEWQKTLTGGKYDWAGALAQCENLEYAGKTDWRLPNPKEFYTIADAGRSNPAFDTAYFPDNSELSSDYFWTSRAKDEGNAYYLDYNDAYSNSAEISNEYNVMCVRGDELPVASFTTKTIRNGVVVIDSATGLMWEKSYYADHSRYWINALSICENLTHAGYSDWRLPNKNELASLLNYEKTESPYSDFPDISTSEIYWSSTTLYDDDKDRGWGIYFDNGRSYAMYKQYNYYTRCVRSE